ncbi:amino acid kinase family protein [Sulfuracidifex tepidarius]|uniref:amino acid kinase family protein n=1 Tax=Sulfuracidifex tepidarius TaxID=1294262 RepID=UPI00139004BC|nr:uridylate kinase [Sulfuracidifex tepidarius]
MGSSGGIAYRIVKIGGSAITCKDVPYCFKVSAAKEIAKQIVKATYHGIAPILIHGGGSFGHYEASIVDERTVPRTSHAMLTLNFLVNSLLIKSGLNTYPVPGKFFTVDVTKSIIRQGMIPLIFGDILPEGKVISGDDIAVTLARELDLGIVFVTDVEGILNQGRIMDCVDNDKAFPVMKTVNPDVTGGILEKVRKILRAEVDAVITSYRDENILRAMRGERVGTRVGKCG